MLYLSAIYAENNLDRMRVNIILPTLSCRCVYENLDKVQIEVAGGND